MTTIHPITVDTGLASGATTRFPTLFPIVKPADCAKIVVEATLAEEEECFVPRHLWYVARLGKVLPRRVQLAAIDFLDYGVGVKND